MSTENAYKLIDQFDAKDGTDYGDETVNDKQTEIEDNNADTVQPEKETQPELDFGKTDKDQQDKTKTTDDKTQQQKKEPQQEQQEQLRPYGRTGLATNAKGDIIDPRSQQIIARAGSERRLFENNERSKYRIAELEETLVKAKKELADVQFLNGIPQKYGMNNDEVFQALEITTLFKKNPVEAARKVVELAVSQGYNVSDILGKDVGDAIEMRAVQRMLDEKLRPVTQQFEQQKRLSEQEEAIQQNIERMNAWMDTRPYAETHIGVLDNLIASNPGMTPDEAYYELRSYCQQHGLDFTKPLQPQIRALEEQKNNPQQQQQRRNPPIPGRGGASQQRTQQTNIDDTQMFDPSMSWSDIVRQFRG